MHVCYIKTTENFTKKYRGDLRRWQETHVPWIRKNNEYSEDNQLFSNESIGLKKILVGIVLPWQNYPKISSGERTIALTDRC